MAVPSIRAQVGAMPSMPPEPMCESPSTANVIGARATAETVSMGLVVIDLMANPPPCSIVMRHIRRVPKLTRMRN
ncbi:hypothetical protein [Microbacterium aquilitoris]|uniref:hypothetical protein n=1 Tax=Microbacterium aquilitoris TaxID=3067307 RepID=UPI0028927F53|nr:hypothetical protein [Microbacterium sp. KSW2-22]MDT3346241.1 hypothetical protein [Microbacterium sp. KSW2-22]